MKHRNLSRSLSPPDTNFHEEHGFSGEGKKANNNIVTVADNKVILMSVHCTKLLFAPTSGLCDILMIKQPFISSR